MGLNLAQGCWTPEETRLPINVLEHWMDLLRGLPLRIHSNNVITLTYVNHQSLMRGAAALDASHNLRWVKLFVPALSAVPLSSVN